MMKTFVSLFALSAALVTGCTADSDPQPSKTSKSITVPAAAATTQATGIVSWEVYGETKDAQALGIGADGAVISALEVQMIDDQTVALRTMGDQPEELRFTKAGTVLTDTLTSDSQTMRVVRAMSNDVQAVKEQYSVWGCIGSLLVEFGACGAAGYELGLNPFADAECVGSGILAYNECTS